MGTRATTRVVDGEWGCLVNLYRQYDGYPEGHGADLAGFLAGIRLVNGFGMSDEEKIGTVANGMGCLAAQLVAHYKDRVGGFYLVPATHAEEYDYEVSAREGGLWIVVRDYGGAVLYEGTPVAFLTSDLVRGGVVA